MTDPEAKAREIALHWFGHASSKHWADELASSIVTALREARSQALEEAAGCAKTEFCLGADDDEIAARIRALKGEQT